MKLFVKISVLTALLLSLFGCASPGSFEARLAPPDDFNPLFLQYKGLPGQKVMTVAVDPGGHWAFGFDHSKDSLEEAAKNAAEKCDEARQQYDVYSKAKVFAINNDIIYYDEFKR